VLRAPHADSGPVGRLGMKEGKIFITMHPLTHTTHTNSRCRNAILRGPHTAYMYLITEHWRRPDLRIHVFTTKRPGMQGNMTP
jgi:hypothetical protein